MGDTFYLEITSQLSETLKNSTGFKSIAAAATDYYEMDNGHHCFLWEDVSAEYTRRLRDHILPNCGFSHFHVVYASVSDDYYMHYGDLYNSDKGLNVGIKLFIKKE